MNHLITFGQLKSGDMGCKPPNLRHKREMIRLWNRFANTPEQQLTRKSFNWDILHGHLCAD